MANRSTRNKIKYQCEKSVNALERGLEHLQSIDELRPEGHPYFNEYMPYLVGGIQKVIEMVKSFNESI